MADNEELDKFKRRLIRTVARMKQENVEDIWANIEKAMGRNCEPLWSRMRALTLKKVFRLLSMGDMPEKLAPVARMSITDWLLLDLVLVHEDIDVTDMGGTPNKVATKSLLTLLCLVEMFKLENSTPEALAQKWAQATVHYNQKGRQCSPMLLQRRWYEMKAKARESFYKYWTSGFNKGNKQENKPSEIYVKIAQIYPHIVTEVLPTWDHMLKNDLIVLPNEFERILKRDTDLSEQAQASTSGEPDLILIEPVIETIDVELVSELEEAAAYYQNDDSNDETPENQTEASKSSLSDTHKVVDNKDLNTSIDLHIQNGEIDISYVTVKKEKIDTYFQEPDGLSNVQIIETTHVVEDTKSGDIILSNENLKGENNTNLTIETEKNLDINICLGIQNNKKHSCEPPINAKTYIMGTEEKKTELIDSETPFILKVESVSEEIAPTLMKEVNKTYEHAEKVYQNNNPIKETTIAADLLKSDNDSDTEIIVRPGPKSKKHLLLTPKKSLYNLVRKTSDSSVMQPIQTTSKPGPRHTKNSVYLENIDNVYEWPKTITDYSNKETVDLRKIDESSKMIVDLEKSTTNIDKEVITENVRQATTSVEKVVLDAIDTDEMDELNECDLDFADDTLDEAAVHIDDATLKSLEQQHTNIILPEDEDKEVTMDESPSSIKMPSSPLMFEEAAENDNTSLEGYATPKFDLKLLMLPVVYTLKLDHMKTLQNINLNATVYGNAVFLDTIEALSKAMSNKRAEFNINNDRIEFSDVDSDERTMISDNDDDNDYDNYANRSDDSVKYTEDETQKQIIVLKENSYLFQKPRNRVYTSIHLCKNPDFNTRLRRLSVGFLTKSRNRQLLKSCKPLTVDLQKAFEEKMVNGILYIARGGQTDINNVETINEIDSQSSTVLPSAMAAQSLIDKETVDKEKLISKANEPSKHDNSLLMARKNKFIVLPDIDKVRQVNRQLLTAQVPPLQTTLRDTTIKIHRNFQGTTTLIEPIQNAVNMTQPTIQAVESVQPNVQVDETVQPKDQVTDNIQPTNQDVEKFQHNAQDENVNNNMSGTVQYKGNKVTSVVNRIDPSDGKRKLEKKIYKVHRLGFKEVKEKIKEKYKKNKTSSNRMHTSVLQPAPWYMRPSRYVNTKDDCLLQEDALQRMLHELTDGPKCKAAPLRKLSYCCLAKRHKVLNNARNRLFINSTGEVKKRRFRNKLHIHTCPTFELCQCCCKLLIDWPNEEGTPKELEQEQIEEMSEDAEINKAIAELESIIAPEPITNRTPTPTVTLAPPMQSFSPKLIKIASKQAETSSVKIIWNTSKTSQSPSNTQGNHCESDNESKDCETEKKLKNDNIIDLSDDEDLQLSELQIRNLKYRDYLNARHGPRKTAIKTKLIPPLPRLQRRRGRGKKSISITNAERVQQKKPSVMPHQNQGHDGEPETEKCSTILAEPENEKSSTMVAPYREPEIEKSSSNLVPQITPITYNNEHSNKNVSQSLLDFPPGTKITLMNNGQVYAINDDGTPFRMTASEQVALRDAVYQQLGVITPVMINNGDMSDTVPEISIPNPSNQGDNEVPVLSISDPKHPIMIPHDTLLHSLGLNTNPVLINEGTKPGQNHNNNIGMNQQLVIDENSGEVIFVQSPEQNETVLNHTEGRETESVINVIGGNTEKILGLADKIAEQRGRVGINESVDDENKPIEVNKHVLEMSSTNKDSKPDDSTATTENISAMARVEDCKLDKSATESSENKQDISAGKRPFLQVKNFAKIKPIEKQMPSDMREPAKEVTLPTAAKTSILSDLMEISGISIDDDQIPELGQNLELRQNPELGHNNVMLVPPATLLELPTAMNSNSKVFMFDSQTGHFNQIYNFDLTSGKRKHIIRQKTMKKNKKTTIKILPDVIELADSDEEETNKGQNELSVERLGENEDLVGTPKTPADVATSQLMRLLSIKRKRKEITNPRTYPDIYKKRDMLKKIIKSNYENCAEAIARVKGKRKEKIEARIDLVDSDAPMEEEYLLDSADSDSEISHSPAKKQRSVAKTQIKETIPIDSDSSSDDEPLAIIVSKKRNTNETGTEKETDVAEEPLAQTAIKGPIEFSSKYADDTSTLSLQKVRDDESSSTTTKKKDAISDINSYDVSDKHTEIEQTNSDSVIEQNSSYSDNGGVESEKINEEIAVVNNGTFCPNPTDFLESQKLIDAETESLESTNAEDLLQLDENQEDKKKRNIRKKDVDSLSNLKYDDSNIERKRRRKIEENNIDDTNISKIKKRKRKKRLSIEATIDTSFNLKTDDVASDTEKMCKKKKHLEQSKVKSIDDLTDTNIEEIIIERKLRRSRLTDNSSDDLSDVRSVDSSITKPKSKSDKRQLRKMKTANKNYTGKVYTECTYKKSGERNPRKNIPNNKNEVGKWFDTIAPTNILNDSFDDPKIGFMWFKRKNTNLPRIYASMNPNNECILQDEESFEKILKRKARGNYTADINSISAFSIKVDTGKKAKEKKAADKGILDGIDTSDYIKTKNEKLKQRKGNIDKKDDVASDANISCSDAQSIDEHSSDDAPCDRKRRKKRKAKEKNVENLGNVLIETLEEINVHCDKIRESSINSDICGENYSHLSQVCDSELREDILSDNESQDCILGI